ncbi:MAG: Piwi domain-containing protein [Nibricoccus sp.]
MLRNRSTPAASVDPTEPSLLLPNNAHHALNAFSVQFDRTKYQVRRLENVQPTQIDELRQRYGASLFIYYREGIAWGLPMQVGGGTDFGTVSELDLNSHTGLDLLRARFADAIPASFESYTPIRTRPFVFLGRRKENNIAAAAFTASQIAHPLTTAFEIWPKFELDGRLIEIEDGKLQLAMTVAISTRWSISAQLAELTQAGVDLRGSYVIRRNPQPKQRSLVGRVSRFENGIVHLDESYDGMTEIAGTEVRLEGSKASYRKCLFRLLGKHPYKNFDEAREEEESRWLGGRESFLSSAKLAETAAKKGALAIAPGLNATIGGRICYSACNERKTWVQFPFVDYCFDAARSKKDQYPWRGIEKFGPFDQDGFEKRSPKILLVAPDTIMNRAEQAMRDFTDGARVSSWAKGFAAYFHLVNVRFVACPVSLSSGSDPARTYCDAIEKHLTRESDFDAAVVIIRDAEAEIDDSRNPYLHAKALLLSTGIPVQEAKESTILKTGDYVGYTYRNIAVALYAKLNGLPWTVSHTRTFHDELVLGIGLAEITGSRIDTHQRHMGITTVFRGDGNYLLSSITNECSYADYPRVLYDSMVQTLSDIRQRNGWQKNDRIRIVFHGSKPLKNVEIDAIMADCVKQAAPEQHVDFAFIDVVQDHPFSVYDTFSEGIELKNDSGRKGVFVPERGLLVQLGNRTRLLSTIGPQQIKRDVTPLPKPLLLKLHDRSTVRDLIYLSEQVLKFTSLTWRSTQPASKPVTIYYSELIAELLARLRAVPGWSPNMLRTKLLASKWFL